MNPTIFPKRVLAHAIVVVLVCIAAPGRADEAADINVLLQNRQYDAALARIDAALKANPRDAQVRFLQGLALANMGRKSEALKVFTTLTVEFPLLAEPYNNLAVLHAGNGQYEKALAALNKATQVDPKYATAYENMGDLYVQLAQQAYGKALQINPGSAEVSARLAKLRKLNEQQPIAPASTPAETPAPAPSSQGEQQAVLSVVQAWAAAWSARDVNTYLGFYDAAFKVPKNEPRGSWEAKRRNLIESKERIEVEVESPQVLVEDRLATIRFRQKYVSDSFNSSERKTLVLQKSNGAWKIIEERSGG